MILPIHSPLAASLSLLAAWGLIGLAGLLRPASVVLAGRVLFPLSAACGVLLALVGLASLGAPAEQSVLPIGLPDLPMHVRQDALSGVFLFLLGIVSAGISIFAAGYFRRGEGTPPGLLCLQYHVFLASMGFVLLANDAYAFMVAWETMALSSYFLVTAQHGLAEIRRAGFLYLLIAHVGAIAILLSFGVMQGGSWQFTFDAMRSAHLAPSWAAVAFLLALAGFGAKAGLVPLHVWLPEAHPAAPSPVSALMSAVMLKTAVYGILRVSFDLLGHTQGWWWGLAPLALGLFTAVFGAVFAAVQTDMKRLLAYSSIENLGIIFAALGLALLFRGAGLLPLAALALAALLYHSLNHAFIKSLLFLGTGSVLHSTGERNLGRLGGLIHRMPWVAALTLVGTLAMAGLPPLNGFVSEWLLLQAFLFAHQIPHTFINMLLPLGAALLALAVALAAYVMVKFFGVTFLGRPREAALARARDAGLLERVGLLWLAAGCFALGLLPSYVIDAMHPVLAQLGSPLPARPSAWWLLSPVPRRQVSYSPVIFLLSLAAIVVMTFLAVRLFHPARRRTAAVWDCGFGGWTARMQDTAEGFGQPIRRIFGDFFAMTREVPSAFDRAPRYRVTVTDRIWQSLYLPLGSLVQRATDTVAWLQQGRIATYLSYSFVTLVVLLALVL